MKSILFSLAFVAFFLTAFFAVSQGVDPVPPPGAIPIDGGVGFLLAAGAAYGAKKIRDFRNAKKNS